MMVQPVWLKPGIWGAVIGGVLLHALTRQGHTSPSVLVEALVAFAGAVVLLFVGRVQPLKGPDVVLKAAEGIGEFLFASIAREARRSFAGKVGGALLKPRLRPLRDRIDYRKTGGALLLGVAGEVVIAHGRSDAEATMNAIRVAARAADQGVSGVIASSVRTPAEVSV